MTIPYERTRALILTRELLKRLAAEGTHNAAQLLKHYPNLAEIEAAHKALPEIFGPVPPFSRLSGSADVRGVIEGAQE